MKKKISSILLIITIICGVIVLYCCDGKHTQIIQPEVDSTEIVKPRINVYIENSGSMDGYVNGVTEFEQSVYSYLSDIKISGVSDSLTLYYINSEPIPYGSDIEDFINKLEPAIFRQRGGDRSTTDIYDLVKNVLANTNEKTVSILISDFIFSPGKGKNAQEYLVNQQIGIKTKFAEYLKYYPNTALCIYQLTSKFEGLYYNREDVPTMINTQRPFYIWIVGDKDFLSMINNKVPHNKIKGNGVKNDLIFLRGNQLVDYRVIPQNGYDLERGIKNSIINAKINSHTKKFSFKVFADFYPLMQDDDYITDSANYSLNDNAYKLNIERVINNDKGFTHLLSITTDDKVKPLDLTVNMLMKVPSWVEEMNDDDGLDIINNGANKTYGLKYLVNGFFEAFTNQDTYYTELKISINKNN